MAATMQVRKRNGDTEPVDVNKIVRAVQRWAGDLDDVDPMRVATKTISGLYDGATTAELDRLSIQTAAEMIAVEPQYSQAGRPAAVGLHREGGARPGHRLVQPVGRARPRRGPDRGRDGEARQGQCPQARLRRRRAGADLQFEYFGIKTVYDRYLLRHPSSRLVTETPQYFLLRVACGLSGTPAEAIGFYRLMSSLRYLPSSPTLFNSGTRHPQLSSCFLVDSPRDELDSIYARYAQVARLSQVLRRDRDRVVADPVPRRADPRHERQVQRDRAVAADAGLLRRGGQPGRPPQGRRVRLPGAVASRCRGVPRTARQHRRGRPARAQPEPRQLGTGRVHAPGRGGRGLVADGPGLGARTARPVGRGVRAGVPRGRGRRPVCAPGQGPRPVREDDAHAGADRQRLDDLQGRFEREVQPDRVRPGTWCTCPTCVPRSWR